MGKRRRRKTRVFLLLMISLVLILEVIEYEMYIGTSTVEKIAVDYTLESIWNGTGVTKVLRSDEYLYFLKDGKTLISIQNGLEKGNFTHNRTIMDAEAWKTAVIIVDDRWDYYWTINFENVTNPQKTANITADGGNSLHFSMYQQYLYLARGHDFHVIDYSSPSSPTYRGSFRLSYHSSSVEVVADCGLFMGDTNTGVYYLSQNPTHPEQLWEIYSTQGAFSYDGTAHSYGTMGVSETFIAYFTKDSYQEPDQKIILVIPRIDKSHVRQSYNVTVEALEITRGLIRGNILVATHDNNINFWSINEAQQTVDVVDTIILEEIETFTSWQWIENTDSFYIVDEGKGVYILSFLFTDIPAIIPAMSFPLLLMSLIGLTLLPRYKKKHLA